MSYLTKPLKDQVMRAFREKDHQGNSKIASTAEPCDSDAVIV